MPTFTINGRTVVLGDPDPSVSDEPVVEPNEPSVYTSDNPDTLVALSILPYFTQR